MDNHLLIEANSQPLALGEDFSLSLEYKNPLFNDAESYSYPAEITLDGNRSLVRNIDDARSPLRPVEIENTKARIYAEGLPVFDGKIKIGDSEEISHTISINIEGGDTLRNLIADLDCKDIPVKDTLIIGKKIKTINASFKGTYHLDVYQEGRDYFFRTSDATGSTSCNPQALGFSKQQNINVDKPYPFPYCNARVAYKHYGVNEERTETTDVVEFGQYGPYMVLDADRPQSGICFYVLYFLDCLFAYLGLEWDNSELLKIEDFTRLCFYTTKCKFDEINETNGGKNMTAFDSLMKSWNCNTKMDIGLDKDEINTVFIPKGSKVYQTEPHSMAEGASLIEGVRLTINEESIMYFDRAVDIFGGNGAKTGPTNIWQYWSDTELTSFEFSTCDMAANSGNFPETSVTTIIESLENMFGIRFIYDAEIKSVKAVFLRDILRNDVPTHNFRGTISEMNKMSEKTSGVFIGYSAESDADDQRKNLRDKIRDYDTSFDYTDYPSPTDHNPSGAALASTTVVKENAYAKIVSKASNNDNTLYIDTLTGNRYRTKVDKDASTTSELKPAWFQVGQFKGVEFGNCSKSNEENIISITTDFLPIILSDVNADNVKKNCSAGYPASKDNTYQPLLVPYCDEDMEHEDIEQYLDYPFDVDSGSVSLRAILKLTENYDVSSSNDGNSPLQSYDWGLTIAIMRGGGSDMTTQTFDKNFDGFSNYRYRSVSGSYALTADTMDMLGSEYDYNGVESGLGRGERFSLFPRAYATPSWAPDGIYTSPDGKQTPLVRADVHTEVSSAEFGIRTEHTYYRTRGWVDRFLYDYAEWLLTRRKFIIRAICSVAMIADIRNHWFDHWVINGERGIINKVSVDLDNLKGLQRVEIEFFTL